MHRCVKSGRLWFVPGAMVPNGVSTYMYEHLRTDDKAANHDESRKRGAVCALALSISERIKNASVKQTVHTHTRAAAAHRIAE